MTACARQMTWHQRGFQDSQFTHFNMYTYIDSIALFTQRHMQSFTHSLSSIVHFYKFFFVCIFVVFFWILDDFCSAMSSSSSFHKSIPIFIYEICYCDYMSFIFKNVCARDIKSMMIIVREIWMTGQKFFLRFFKEENHWFDSDCGCALCQKWKE